MADIKLTIDGVQVTVPEGTSVLEAARQAKINIPTLCYHKDLNPTGACGLCVVEVEGVDTLKRACVTNVVKDMVVKTHTKKTMDARRSVLELILANHPDECLECIRNQTCELQAMAEKFNVRRIPYERTVKDLPIDAKGVIIKDSRKCILCGRCVEACQTIQTVNAIDFVNRGFDSKVGTFNDLPLSETTCVNCGQCVLACPVGALYERSDEAKVWEALNDPTKHVVVQEAPAVRVTIGEPFGLAPGTVGSGKMHAALKMMGFDRVFDTNFSADLTILEEGTEVIGKVVKALESGDFKNNLPVVTSCSPGWIKFMETYYPFLSNHISTAKSPQQMFGALAKTYYAEVAKVDPASIVSVSVMPCTAKKFEAARPEMNASGYQDVDYVLTTRELARMIKEAGIDFASLSDEPAEDLMGSYTGAATIFGATGGVMEAALRTVYAVVSGEELGNLDIMPVRGLDGVKEATVEVPLKKELKEKFNLDKLPVSVAVAHGLGNARKLMDIVKQDLEEKGQCRYHFIEIMACPGGCVGGGGQPHGCDLSCKGTRASGLYKEDKEMLEYRCSHHNPAVKKLYEDFLGEPNSHKAHELLHTHYTDRAKLV